MPNNSSKRVFVAGHQGMVGRALVRRLGSQANISLITQTWQQLDLLDHKAVKHFFASKQIDEVYVAAAKVCGIHANNSFPAEFIYQNLMIEANIIHIAHMHNINNILFLGASCIYPKHSEQPIKESALMSSYLEPTNEPYVVAKIAGIKLCESYSRQYGRDYRSVMPTNLYGIHDNFHPQNSHVIPALMHKFYQAIQQGIQQDIATVNIWGTGEARREFLYVDDLADACVHLMGIDKIQFSLLPDMCSHVNIGTGTDCSIKQLAELLRDISGFTGGLIFEADKPEGPLIKKLDITLLRDSFGWTPSQNFEAGLKLVWAWFIQSKTQ